ncbi:transcriptional regulator SPT3 [Ascoidea rubescens DSM 1968]|uniref:TFIID-18kDa-domain-containing protein n=1 Tax=Ascoidea rubescens DSM 1968 TaxID=1344418 RepID=A0A1D2VL52_9ASCO|nr:TFIID-18kDa-domain-containing protein [Ascoidea rubescens DSM 1968]ODV62340.1 TFIID-18kDa-domain-containing protein [Ascoidea rubescens DSM 1968]
MADKYKYKIEIQQMMFVSGETNEPPIETTSIIEDIVRGQVVEILLQASRTAYARNTKSIAPEDVIFLIRHDKAKVNRLRTYLSWKDVRKNAKDQENGGVDPSADLIDEHGGGPGGGTKGGMLLNGGSNGSSVGANNGGNIMKLKKSKIRLPWELPFMFSEQPLENNEDDDLVDDDEKKAIIASLKRLKQADERTKGMTKDEYVHWSECRQASFTFRKAKRFKDWCGTSYILETKPSDDVIDILGFLTFEIVCSLTEEALEVKSHEESLRKDQQRTEASAGGRKRRRYLFDGPEEAAQALQPGHIEEAWRRLQQVSHRHRALLNHRGGKLFARTQII